MVYLFTLSYSLSSKALWCLLAGRKLIKSGIQEFFIKYNQGQFTILHIPGFYCIFVFVMFHYTDIHSAIFMRRWVVLNVYVKTAGHQWLLTVLQARSNEYVLLSVTWRRTIFTSVTVKFTLAFCTLHVIHVIWIANAMSAMTVWLGEGLRANTSMFYCD